MLNRRYDGKFSISIWWSRVPSLALTADKINLLLEGLDDSLTYKETKKGCRTIATTGGLRQSYFVRDEGREICGVRETDENVMVFRYVLTFADKEKGEERPDLANNFFNNKTKEILGETIQVIFGSLPEELHEGRRCVPSPINWVHPMWVNKEVNGCVKADICSAYGTEGSKPLPDCHAKSRKIVDGVVEPNEEYPFAFYLESGEMAVWGEGDSWTCSASRYMGGKKRMFAANERTMLCKAAKKTLRKVFEFFYDGRKENEWYKFVMVATIGMWHRQEYSTYCPELWPLAAVIKFRCNKRIIDYCDQLVEMGQLPMLINTDSITWVGTDTSLTTTEKKLGNFALENKVCSLLYTGPKKYQVRDDETGKVITRWSGNHRKSITEKLAFGELLNKEIIKMLEEQEKKATYKWSKERRRFINKLGEIYTREDLLMEEYNDD